PAPRRRTRRARRFARARRWRGFRPGRYHRGAPPPPRSRRRWSRCRARAWRMVYNSGMAQASIMLRIGTRGSPLALAQARAVRDAFISRKAAGLSALPADSVVGTSSLRRQAQVRRLRPDLTVVDFRGNVETRLRKLAEGVADATLLALAGLKRLGLAQAATAILPIEEFLPAVGQGAIALETRAADARVRDLIAAGDHAETRVAPTAGPAFPAQLDG